MSKKLILILAIIVFSLSAMYFVSLYFRNQADQNQPNLTAIDQNIDQVRVAYTNEGFEPNIVALDRGVELLFVNSSDIAMWIVADDATLKELPRFDQLQGIGPGEEYTIRINKAGDHTYINKTTPEHSGRVIISD